MVLKPYMLWRSQYLWLLTSRNRADGMNGMTMKTLRCKRPGPHYKSHSFPEFKGRGDPQTFLFGAWDITFHPLMPVTG